MNRRAFLRRDFRTAAASRPSAGLKPFTAEIDGPWDYHRAAHLLRRCMAGPTDAEIRRAVAEGLDRTLERLLTPFEPSTAMIGDFAGREPWVDNPPEGPDYNVWLAAMLERRDRLVKWWLHTIAASPVSLQETMTFFWHNHFATDIGKVTFAEWMYGQNILLRRNALGNFKELTHAVTKDIAMLIYLDGTANGRYRLNENYARELMELFTVGVYDSLGKPNYSQSDVKEAARAFTGWTIAPSALNPLDRSLESAFDPDLWDPGEKTVFGRRGRWGADDIVDLIFAERGTQVASFICRKIYRAFVYDEPDEEIVEGMASAFITGGWEILPVMRLLLRSSHFYRETNIGALYRSHINFFLSMIRGIGLKDVPDFDPANRSPYHDLSRRLRGMGQIPLSPPGVDGWTGGRYWVTSSTLPAREAFAVAVAEHAVRYITPSHDWVRLFTFNADEFARSFPGAVDAAGVCREISRYVLGADPSEEDMERLYAILLDGGPAYEWDQDDPAQRTDSRIRKLIAALYRMPQVHLC